MQIPLVPPIMKQCSWILSVSNYIDFTSVKRGMINFHWKQFSQNCLLSSKRGSTLKGKNLLPRGSQYLPFRVDIFPERGWCTEKQTRRHKSCLPCPPSGSSHLTSSSLTIVLLNKLKCHSHFQFSAKQLIWTSLLIQIHILNDNKCSSKSFGFKKPTGLHLHCL